MQRRFTFARIDISYARFFFYESAEKVLSYARLNYAVFIIFICHLDRLEIKLGKLSVSRGTRIGR